MNESGKVTEQAYAKINTYLDVLGRRADGYHEIVSYMQHVTLGDMLTIERRASRAFSVSLSVDDPRIPTGGDNLIIRAGCAFAEEYERLHGALTGDFSACLKKKIPMAAGLAGGSADAAAMLRAMNNLTGCPFRREELCGIARRIGADVPFCVCTDEGAMTAHGVGELLEKTIGLPENTHLVIACNGEGVSTPWAYGEIDRLGVIPGDYGAFASALEAGDLTKIGAASRNVFEKVVLPVRPAAAALKINMEKSGAAFARMSGSGPSVVGYFDEEKTARDCARMLTEQGIFAALCQARG